MTRRESRRMVIVLAVLALAFLGIAVWTLAQGSAVEAVGHSLVAVLAVLAALLVNNPDRTKAVQRRIFIAAMTLVPIILAVFVASIFF